METVLDVDIVTRDTEGMAQTTMEGESDDTKQMMPWPLKYTIKPSSDMRGEIERLLAYFGVMMNTDLKVIVNNHFTIWTATIQLQIVKHMKSTFLAVLQTPF